MYSRNKSKDRLSTYRYLQILAHLCNEVLQQWILPVLIAGTVVGLGVSLPTLITTSSKVGNIPVQILLAVTCADYVLFLMFILRGLAEVLGESNRALQGIVPSLLVIPDRKSRKCTPLFLKSCGQLKMKFGGNSFIEMLSPLNCISHSGQLSVHILLLGGTNKQGFTYHQQVMNSVLRIHCKGM